MSQIKTQSSVRSDVHNSVEGISDKTHTVMVSCYT